MLFMQELWLYKLKGQRGSDLENEFKKRLAKKNDLMKVQFVFNLSTCRLCVDDQSIHAIMIAKSFLFEELRVIVK